MRYSFLRVPLFLAAAVLGSLSVGCNLEHTGGSAAPNPVPTPTPQPTPAAPVQVFGCGLPRGTGDGRNCGDESHNVKFAAQVAAAIAKTQRDHPEWFAGDVALEVGRYVDETVDNLRRMGFCALNDGEEIAVKENNDFNEQWDIIRSDGGVIQRYEATCRPAWSAIPPAGNGS